MRNKHGGDCYQCGNWVVPGTGHFERHRGGWRVKHANVRGHGQLEYRVFKTGVDASGAICPGDGWGDWTIVPEFDATHPAVTPAEAT